MIYYNLISSYSEYSLSLIILNIFIYVILILNLFLLLFLFDLKYIKTLSDIKFINNLPFISIFVIVLLLSFAGIPPLLGFLSKFLMFLFLFFKKNYFYVFIFLFINMFSIYFYIQNLRFLISKNSSNKFSIKNNLIVFNANLLFYINFLNFFNVFSIFFIEDVVLYFNFLVSFIFL